MGIVVDNNVLDEEISLKEVDNAIEKLKNNKAPGFDGIPAEFYKLAKTCSGECIKNIFNALYINAYFPEMWRRALIMPLPKKVI